MGQLSRHLALVTGQSLPPLPAGAALFRRKEDFLYRCSRSPDAASPSPWQHNSGCSPSPHLRAQPWRTGSVNEHELWGWVIRKKDTQDTHFSSVSGLMPGCFPKKKLDHQWPESCFGSPADTSGHFQVSADRIIVSDQGWAAQPHAHLGPLLFILAPRRSSQHVMTWPYLCLLINLNFLELYFLCFHCESGGSAATTTEEWLHFRGFFFFFTWVVWDDLAAILRTATRAAAGCRANAPCVSMRRHQNTGLTTDNHAIEKWVHFWAAKSCQIKSPRCDAWMWKGSPMTVKPPANGRGNCKSARAAHSDHKRAKFQFTPSPSCGFPWHQPLNSRDFYGFFPQSNKLNV